MIPNLTNKYSIQFLNSLCDAFDEPLDSKNGTAVTYVEEHEYAGATLSDTVDITRELTDMKRRPWLQLGNSPIDARFHEKGLRHFGG